MDQVMVSEAGNPENQDRAMILEDAESYLLCVADGAGGLSGGSEAAALAIEFMRNRHGRMADAEACDRELQQLDSSIATDGTAGETTCAFAVVKPAEVFGASVGDSGVWLILEDGTRVDLTRSQRRKPLLGSGYAEPVSFTHPNRGGLLLLATDGSLKYTSPQRIIETCLQNRSPLPAKALLELVRYPSGVLPDDVTIILARL